MTKVYQAIQCYDDDHPKNYTFFLESEKYLNRNEIVIVLTSKYLGHTTLELHHIDNIVAIRAISADEYCDGCGLEPETVPQTFTNRFEDAIVAIRDHGWSFESSGDGRRSILSPPEGDPRRFWTAMWDDNGFPHWLPQYSVKDNDNI